MVGLDTLSVYFAGKIGKRDWRHQLFPRLGESRVIDTGGHGWRIAGADVDGRDGRGDELRRGVVRYCGPFFMQCDEHGSVHGPRTHGLGAGDTPCGSIPRRDATALCLNWLAQADLVFAWIDSPTAHGTLWELGYACAMRKTIVIGFPTWDLAEEMWFAAETANDVLVEASARQAFDNSWVVDQQIRGTILFSHPRCRAALDIACHTPYQSQSAPGFIYLLSAGEFFKIGKTVCVDNRVRQLSIQLPQRPNVEHVIKVQHIHAAERFYHEVFRPQRTNGEWFRLTGEDVEWMKSQRSWEWAPHR